jgi:hypothetical protein
MGIKPSAGFKRRLDNEDTTYKVNAAMQGGNSSNRVIAQVAPNNSAFPQYAAYTTPVSTEEYDYDNGYDYNSGNNPIDPNYAADNHPGYVAYESNGFDNNQQYQSDPNHIQQYRL